SSFPTRRSSDLAGDFLAGNGVTYAQTREAVHFGERACHNEVFVLRNTLKAIGEALFHHIFYVGFVEHHEHTLRHTLEEAIELLTSQPSACGIVGGGHKNEA